LINDEKGAEPSLPPFKLLLNYGLPWFFSRKITFLKIIYPQTRTATSSISKLFSQILPPHQIPFVKLNAILSVTTTARILILLGRR